MSKRSADKVDRPVREGKGPIRSQALQPKADRTRLAIELAKLDRSEEQRLAEEGLRDPSWPIL
jgi:hypothetical protein